MLHNVLRTLWDSVSLLGDIHVVIPLFTITSYECLETILQMILEATTNSYPWQSFVYKMSLQGKKVIW